MIAKHADRRKKTALIDRLHRRYGMSEHECGQCSQFENIEELKHGYCNLIGRSHWKATWKACGKYESLG